MRLPGQAAACGGFALARRAPQTMKMSLSDGAISFGVRWGSQLAWLTSWLADFALDYWFAATSRVAGATFVLFNKI